MAVIQILRGKYEFFSLKLSLSDELQELQWGHAVVVIDSGGPRARKQKTGPPLSNT